MKKHKYKAVISASGVGSRLGEITKYLNKALVRIGKKASISYILDKIPQDVVIVITLGYKADLVIEYLSLAHPERQFEFVYVDNFEGKGSSLGYSLLCARDALRCPFVFITNDTVCSIDVHLPQNNWVGVQRVSSSDLYSTVTIKDDHAIASFHKKKSETYDFGYVGIAGIKDHELFWDILGTLYQSDPYDASLNDISVFSSMIAQGSYFHYKLAKFWFDIGNEEGLSIARKNTDDYFDNLEKLDESIYIFSDKFVVKYFDNQNIVKTRIERANILKAITPKVLEYSDHFYKYEYIKGRLLSSCSTETLFEQFLFWCLKHLWIPVELIEIQKKEFPNHCKNFYRKKTLDRLEKYFSEISVIDKENQINHVHVPTVDELFSYINWDLLYAGVPVQFHGDLHFENILKTDNGFVLLDWRQDFDGIIEYGDIYYDLAKIYHGIVVSHEIIRNEQYQIIESTQGIHLDIFRSDDSLACEKRFFQFLKDHQFSCEKVEILTALIFLNISPLHHKPYGTFLFYLGKLRLYEALRKYSRISCNVGV